MKNLYLADNIDPLNYMKALAVWVARKYEVDKELFAFRLFIWEEFSKLIG